MCLSMMCLDCVFFLFQLESFVRSGPNMSEVVCVECEGEAMGELCDTCRSGYYDSNFNLQSTVSCEQYVCVVCLVPLVCLACRLCRYSQVGVS